ncbi:hypothetical protein [Streptomyces sp. NBC_01244]|uniref:hypothetical protein n=1 Tax=Streptomyces sp. NBC_01244 TaxID=2903797 RepID=UPI002E15C409|nr:hypothetical protein OG247_31125 [Streptomyces sp. NBC_01244]
MRQSLATVRQVRTGTYLHFSCTLPNLIVGPVGNGKGLGFVEENRARPGCRTVVFAEVIGNSYTRLAGLFRLFGHKRVQEPR